MQKIGTLVAALMCFGLVALAVAEVQTDERVKNDDDVVECDYTEKKTFQFTDIHQTKFVIPKIYEYKPYRTYEKHQAENTMVLYFHKETFKPDCRKIHAMDGKHHLLRVKALKPNAFENIIESRMKNILNLLNGTVFSNYTVNPKRLVVGIQTEFVIF